MNKTLQALTATTGTRHDCWNTPKEIIEDVLKFFNGNIELDPCSNSQINPNIPAKILFTEDTNGLSQEWIANSVFVNHPYSDSKNWIPYLVSQYENRNSKEIILLTKLDVSTKWWRCISNYPWVAVNKRLKFGTSTSAAPFQSAIVYLGENLTKFSDVFHKYGTIYIPFS